MKHDRALSISDVSKSFGTQTVLSAIDLEIEKGEFVVLVGPSGCGKSTLLRMIAGLEDISGGEIEINGTNVNNLEPMHRDIAMVFQNYALYPHMTVRQNLSYSLKMRKQPKDFIEQRVTEVAESLELDELLDRYPRQLSGGQRQRVAMGRAIVREPSVFLYDEPLSNLDAALRVKMRVTVRELHLKLGNTSIYVTHDQVEAMTMADRIVIMRGGLIEQVGSPEDVYDRPVNTFVAGFIGSPAMNFINAKVKRTNGEALAELENGETLPIDNSVKIPEHNELILGIRPEHLVEDQSNGPFSFQVDMTEMLGRETLHYGKIGDVPICAAFGSRMKTESGKVMRLNVSAGSLHYFDAQSLKNLMV